MHGELPEFKRCCFCLPLRRGLIGWAYFRLGLNLLAMIGFVFIVIQMSPRRYNGDIGDMIFFCIYRFIDAVFAMFLMVGGHKKNFKLLRISYIYSIAWLIIYVAFITYGLITDITRIDTIWDYYSSHRYLNLVVTAALVFAFMFIQVYMILLIRSESIKLQNQSLEMQFVNNATEAETRCVSAEQSTEQYTHEKYSAQYTENGPDISVQHGVY